jgi:kynurenine formamidase
MCDTLRNFFALSRLTSIEPEETKGNGAITVSAIEKALTGFHGEALIVRTLPNEESKKRRSWSGSNPPFFQPGVGNLLREAGIKHFLVDLPSVDAEQDGGVMAIHHEFWNYPASPRLDATITEMIYVDNQLPDANYMLQFSIPPLQTDAVPSQILLYSLLG